MKISSSFNTNDRNRNCQSFKKGVPSNPVILPEFVGKIGKVAGEYIRTPEQKLILATCALFIQPLMDLAFADKDKKQDAAIKSASKAMAGGLTGVAIRAGSQSLIAHSLKNRNTILFPTKYMDYALNHPEMADFMVNEYSKNLGAIIAIAFMIFFSNSKVDVPLTSDFQDLISGVVKNNKTWLKSLSDVANARKTKIKNWILKKKSKLDIIKDKIIKIFNIIIEKNVPESKEYKS